MNTTQDGTSSPASSLEARAQDGDRLTAQLERRPLRVAVTGASGRMGQAILQEILEQPDLHVSSAVVRAGHAWAGRDLGICLGRLPLGTLVATDLAVALEETDVIIDFTHPGHLLELLPRLRGSNLGLVCGTTGLSEEVLSLLRVHAQEAPVVVAANMSLGVNVLLGLVRQAAALLGDGFDLEVLEIHHRFKKDAPSGTALALAKAGLDARGVTDAQGIVLREQGMIGARSGREEVGVGALRGGSVAGEHTVYFLGSGERLELTHRAVDRRAFAQGAVRAARWLAERAPGYYSMQDVLGLSSTGRG